jgi:hypothetical protein
MSRQAEAERERRARIITADGEFQASKRLAAAANVMARDPAALQLRLLQTVVEVAAERNSTLVMPIPVELLRFFDKFTPGSASGSGPAQESLGDYSEAEVALPEKAVEQLADPTTDPLEIPDVPAIPELSAAEKGERAAPGSPLAEPAAEPAPVPADGEANGQAAGGASAASATPENPDSPAKS